jgi:serine/threonine protein kinase
MLPAINDLLHDRYLILKNLSHGGFSTTFLAKDTMLPDMPLCVVKCLKRSPLPHQANLFEAEVQTLYQLGRLTSQIPALLDHFVEEQLFYLIQEFIEGQTLARSIHSKHSNQSDIVDLLQQLLTVLQLLHSHQIIHGDIKPSNLIRRPDGQWVLIDFGAVKLASVETVEAMVVGTIGYMPNEQQSGRSRFSSDLYALGMVAIQCLTGVHPKHWTEDPNTGEILWNAKLDPPLRKILGKMVRARLRDRYSSVTDVLIDLDKLKPSLVKSHLPHTFLAGCITFILLSAILYVQVPYRDAFVKFLQVASISIPFVSGSILMRLRLW